MRVTPSLLISISTGYKKSLVETIWLQIVKCIATFSNELLSLVALLLSNICCAPFLPPSKEPGAQRQHEKERESTQWKGEWVLMLLRRIYFLWRDTALSLPFCGVEVHKIYTLLSWPRFAKLMCALCVVFFDIILRKIHNLIAGIVGEPWFIHLSVPILVLKIHVSQ